MGRSDSNYPPSMLLPQGTDRSSRKDAEALIRNAYFIMKYLTGVEENIFGAAGNCSPPSLTT